MYHIDLTLTDTKIIFDYYRIKKGFGLRESKDLSERMKLISSDSYSDFVETINYFHSKYALFSIKCDHTFSSPYYQPSTGGAVTLE